MKYSETVYCPKCGEDINDSGDWGDHRRTCDECQMSCGWCICADLNEIGVGA